MHKYSAPFPWPLNYYRIYRIYPSLLKKKKKNCHHRVLAFSFRDKINVLLKTWRAVSLKLTTRLSGINSSSFRSTQSDGLHKAPLSERLSKRFLREEMVVDHKDITTLTPKFLSIVYKHFKNDVPDS